MEPLKMLVIKPGIDYKKTWRLNVVCGRGGSLTSKFNRERGNAPCGATLKININDVFTTGKYEGGYFKKGYFIKCPCCNCLTQLIDTDIPYYIAMVADKKTEENYDKQVEEEKKNNPNYETDLYKKEDEGGNNISGDKDYIDLE